MAIKLIYIFHNGHERGEITLDCRLRIEAARVLALKESEADIFFVGGFGISGAKDMQKFWQEHCTKLPNKLHTLEKANNTADAVKEISESALNFKEKKEVLLISSAYHIKRIAYFAKINSLDAEIIAAEDILDKMDKFSLEVMIYRNSFKYKLKNMADEVILFYASSIDHGQRMVKIWRKYTRRWKQIFNKY